ncbi:MAG: hypothetical protein IJ046_02110, partial [Clostridia bacterium]|nr:hypothetical protein [Clostridia bacterium]
KKIIAEYKEREKATARALILFERKIKFLKTSMIDDVLKLCKNIEELKNQYTERCSQIYNSEMKEDLLSFKDNYTLNIVPPNLPFVKDYFDYRQIFENPLHKRQKGNIIIYGKYKDPCLYIQRKEDL